MSTCRPACSIRENLPKRSTTPAVYVRTVYSVFTTRISAITARTARKTREAAAILSIHSLAKLLNCSRPKHTSRAQLGFAALLLPLCHVSCGCRPDAGHMQDAVAGDGS